MIGIVPSDKLADMIEREIYSTVDKYRFEDWNEETKNKVTSEVNNILKKYSLDGKIQFNVCYNKQDNEIVVYFHDSYESNRQFLN